MTNEEVAEYAKLYAKIQVEANKHVLRIIALTCNDPLIVNFSLKMLAENVEQAKSKLSDTCWANSLGNLREALEAQYPETINITDENE